MVSIDTSILSLLLHPSAKPPIDPATNKPLEKAHERVDQLVDDLDSAKERIIIPAPALSEFLVIADAAGPQYLAEISNLSHVYIEPFDQLAAIELAAMELLARKTGNKRHPLPPDVPWQKVKFDRQIVAIAKRIGCRAIYSDDEHVRRIAEDIGMKVTSSWELPFPQSKTPLLDASGNPIIL
ncbi:type II toxin-antitoxin system VapC family toxin [Acidicapsa acidisoli]|uniref:type II toxin-antitoxin system VapC family toxin n=1 Tax=Acidicapsa acidisoli TaxID=1615681 RepID=UPI0021E04B24|nr:type II toxin-antitoxin system VapC family toxin [Acidicapsa acidisoli]